MPVFDLNKRRRAAVRPSPVFLAFVGLSVLGGWLSYRDSTPQSRVADFGVFVMVAAGWVVSLCLHEFAHAYAAYRAGDRTVEAAGYLTLNPVRYAHPVLSLLLPLIFIVQGGIGLPGGAVYLHRHNFRSKAMQSLAAAVGPLTNAAFAAVLLALVHANTHSLHPRLWTGLAFLGFLQITAAMLNLMPIPGLDGWAIIEPYLDPATAAGAEKIKPWGMIAVIVLLQVDQLRRWFFAVVDHIYDLSGLPRVFFAFGHEFFRFWQSPPF